MKPAFIIGNGNSRLRYDLTKLGQYGKTYGCNALYRDFMPDVLCSVDGSMVGEILRAEAHLKTEFYVDPTVEKSIYQHLPLVKVAETNFPALMDSGNLASLLACQQGALQVYLIGFDYISETKYSNNVYVNGQNYRKSVDLHVTKPTEWSWYYRAIINCLRNPKVQFDRVNANNYWPPIREPNFTNLHHSLFEGRFPGILKEMT